MTAAAHNPARDAAHDRAVGPVPRVSVIVPVRDEAAHLGRCLAALRAQDYPADRFEILVVDGRSRDGTAAVAARAAESEEGPPIRLLDNPARHAGPAMNRGIEASCGDVIVRVDGHSEAPPAFLRRSVALLEASGADCAGGRLRTRGEGWVGGAVAAAMESPFGVGASAFRTGVGPERDVETVAFGAYRRAALERVGGFDERFVRNQDDELHLRLVQAGGRIRFSPEIDCAYVCRGSLGALARQFFGYGRWKYAVRRERGALPSARALVPAAFVAAVVGGALAAASLGPVWLLAVVLPYVVASCVAAVAAAARRGWRLLPLLPVVFAVMHLAYGAGFWVGVLRRPVR